MDKGVNLGNWLVLEKWMSPGLFAGTDAEDESSLWAELADSASIERFRTHRDGYILDRDFAYLSRLGINFVRIPVPYFIFGDYGKFIGCVDYLDKAFKWGERFGIKILIDLHTVPGSQNGFDNGGLSGVCKFHTDPDNVDFALGVLERLTARYAGYWNLWGIEVLNEPVSPELWSIIDVPKRFPPKDKSAAEGSNGVPTEFLREFYGRAYEVIRRQSESARIVFHDGFRISEWVGFFKEPEFKNFIVDTHMYLMTFALTKGHGELSDFLEYIDKDFGGTISKLSKSFPILVGEWSVDTASKKAAELTGEEKIRYYNQIAEAHLRAWQHASAWCYWSYKMQLDSPSFDHWDFGKAVELGLLPLNMMSGNKAERLAGAN